MTSTEDLRVQVATLQIQVQLQQKVLQNVRKFTEQLHDFEDDDAQVEVFDGDMLAYDLYEILNGHGNEE